jgi:hypothetical protein
MAEAHLPIVRVAGAGRGHDVDSSRQHRIIESVSVSTARHRGAAAPGPVVGTVTRHDLVAGRRASDGTAVPA